MVLYDNLQINEKGHLEIGGCDCEKLAEKYGTPLYVMDETQIRRNCRAYKNAVKKYFGEEGGDVAFASKALSLVGIYRIMQEEGLWTDIVSPGELETVKAAGFPLEKAYYHGNNKTDFDIEYGLKNDIGVFVVDNIEEIEALGALCEKHNKRQKILLRVAPGIDAHTHAKITTGTVDSKFGIAIETGQATEAVGLALKCEYLEFSGIHCHIGSQITEIRPFVEAAECMIDFAAEIKNIYGREISILNLGGGFGVKYTAEQEGLDIDCGVKAISECIIKKCGESCLKMPKVIFEPGRSIVADAGLTLYTVGTHKKITGYKNYISIDGSMADNPRYALYEAPHPVVAAGKMNDECDIVADIAGRCCESGDFIQGAVSLPDLRRGDILAVLATGAYNYSMASNYNRLPKPAMVFVKEGESEIAVNRETYEDLIKNEV